MMRPILIRPAGPEDAEAVTALISASYYEILPRDYPADVLAPVLPLITKAQPALLGSGTYFVASCEETGALIGAGGWTDVSPTHGVAPLGEGHMRHVATHPDALRRGVGRALLRTVKASARNFGVETLRCMSTFSAIPFYQAMGFDVLGEVELRMGAEAYLPVAEMRMAL